MERDLTSLDGLDDYGTCYDKISLLSTTEYAKYRKIFGLNCNYSDWWWTITPFSTPNNGYSNLICTVNTSGALDSTSGILCYEVRPFFMLNAETLVFQKKKEKR